MWKLGALRAALTSVAACPCLDMEFIHAKQGESPAFRVLWPRVVEHFGEHFQVMTGDAGLCAAENASLVLSSHKHYLLGLKGNQPMLHDYAVVAIASNQGPPLLPSTVFEGSRPSNDPARCRVAFLQTSGMPAASQILAVRSE